MKKLIFFLVCFAYLNGANLSAQNTCDTPTGFSLAGVSPNTVYIKWNEVTSAKSYVVNYGPINVNPNTWARKIICAPNWFASISDLQPNVTYGFQIRANCSNCQNAAGTGFRSNFSQTLIVTTPNG